MSHSFRIKTAGYWHRIFDEKKKRPLEHAAAPFPPSPDRPVLH